jgi:hypothetical protein
LLQTARAEAGLRPGTLLFALRGRADGMDLDGCAGCGLGGLESELLPERRGVTFEEEAVSAGAGSVVCCSSGLGRSTMDCQQFVSQFRGIRNNFEKMGELPRGLQATGGGKPIECLAQCHLAL